MELLNATSMVAGYTLGLDPEGREYLVVAVKGTFRIAGADGEPCLAEEQEPLAMADTFAGEPGLSSTVYESDFPYIKPRCDVLLHGSAYAPGGRPAPRVTVGLGIGSLSKSFDVVGHRHWTFGGIEPSPSEARPFAVMPISYDRAFGGTDVSTRDPDERAAFLPNPVGAGYHPIRHRPDELGGRPLPNTEEIGNPIRSPKASYNPMSFGPVGRNFQGRVALAGTYDQRWLDEVCPFLPADFNPLYFQSAPPDQQIDHPRGGETVVLLNLTPAGRMTFQLPSVDVPVEFVDQRLRCREHAAIIDTVVIEPDAGRLLLTWRAVVPLKSSVFEIAQVVVGKMPAGWYRARATGKTYYKSLGAAVRARRRGMLEE